MSSGYYHSLSLPCIAQHTQDRRIVGAFSDNNWAEVLALFMKRIWPRDWMCLLQSFGSLLRMVTRATTVLIVAPSCSRLNDFGVFERLRDCLWVYHGNAFAEGEGGAFNDMHDIPRCDIQYAWGLMIEHRPRSACAFLIYFLCKRKKKNTHTKGSTRIHFPACLCMWRTRVRLPAPHRQA